MFTVAAKAMMIEALTSGFAVINPNPQGQPTGVEMVPQSIGLDYPEQEYDWPACLVQFHPSLVQWTGLNPDFYSPAIGSNIQTQERQVYFEGSWDLSVVSVASEERDRLWDSLFDIVFMNSVSQGSSAFWNVINNYDLIGVTILPSSVVPLGDTISPGVPWNPELLIFEATVRLRGVGVYTPPTVGQLETLTEIQVTGTDELEGETETVVVT